MDGLLIGRFQPFHFGHLEALQFALSKVDKLWVGLGISNKPVEKNNPFTAEQRKEMILSSIDDSMKEKISIYFIPVASVGIQYPDSLINLPCPAYQTNNEFTLLLFTKSLNSIEKKRSNSDFFMFFL